MKKLFLFVSVAILATIHAQSQFSVRLPARKNIDPVDSDRQSYPALTLAARHTPANQVTTAFWTNDFANPSSWVISHDPGTSGDWVIGTSGPGGGFRISTIASATAANGFALFDSDALCTGNQVGNLTTASPINCSGHSSVRLTFSQYYKHFYDSTFVFVSNNGSNWVKFPVNSTLPYNGYSGGSSAINPNIVNVNISSVAANQSTVYLRFQYYSPSSAFGTNAGCNYAWMIDDLSLSDIPSTDALLLTTAYPKNYSLLPIAQVQGFGLNARMINNGLTSFSNAYIFFDVFQGNLGNPVYSDISNPTPNLNGGDTSAMLTPVTPYYPTDTGIYILRYVASTIGDVDGSNDTAYCFVYVNDSIYARDYTAISSADYAGIYGFDNKTGSFGMKYHVYRASQFTSVSLYIGAAVIGDRISVTVSSLSGNPPGTQLGTTGTYTFTAADTGGKLMTLPLQSPVNVTSGDYFIAYHQLDSANVGLGAAAGIYSANTIYYSTSGGPWSTIESTGQPLIFILRVNNPSSTIAGITGPQMNDGFTIFPNPSKGVIYLMNDGAPGNDVNVTITDALGQVVLTRMFSSLVNEKLDLRGQPDGLYNVQVRSSAGMITKTIFISNR